jgi:hypothetical protein
MASSTTTKPPTMRDLSSRNAIGFTPLLVHAAQNKKNAPRPFLDEEHFSKQYMKTDYFIDTRFCENELPLSINRTIYAPLDSMAGSDFITLSPALICLTLLV